MCGIAGFLSPKSAPSRELGEKMLNQLTHRGPDEAFLFSNDQVFLGSRRLAIVSVDNGAQPAFSEDKNVSVVFNGEIYNWKELKSELRAKGHDVREGSDVEVIPHAYEEWGLDFPSHFNGDFAIALWDHRKQELVLARDRIGIKPLYYATAENGDFVFGSEVKALFTHPRMARRFNERALAEIFSFWTVVDSHSVFDGIAQVECGMVCRFDNRGVLLEKRRYWEIPFAQDVPAFRGSFEECKEAFRAKLAESVRLRLMADVDVGTYTSGGIDSSVINHVAYKELRHRNTQTFSVTFEDPLYDERKYQRLLADSLGLTYNEVRCSNQDIYANFGKAIQHTESPIFRTAPIPLMLLSRRVRERGVKVVLTGEGSDEVAWGYDIFRETKVRRFWAKHPESKARPQLFRKMYAYLPQFQDQRYFNLILDFFKVGLTDLSNPLYSHLTRISNSTALHGFWSEGFKSRVASSSPLRSLEESLPKDFGKRSALEKCQHLEMRTLLNGYLLSSQGDRMLSANGVEGRFPYLDHHVIEFLAGVPEKFKLNGLKDKHILRETYKDQLPRELIYRPKHAYRAPEMQAFVEDKDGYVAELLSEKAMEDAGVFSRPQIEPLLRRMKTLKPDKFTTRDNLAFIQILSTQMAHALFIKR